VETAGSLHFCYVFLSPPEEGLNLVTNRQGAIKLASTESPGNFRKRSLRRSRFEHGGVGLGPVGFSEPPPEGGLDLATNRKGAI